MYLFRKEGRYRNVQEGTGRCRKVQGGRSDLANLASGKQRFSIRQCRLNRKKASVDRGRPLVASESSKESKVHSSTRDRTLETCEVRIQLNPLKHTFILVVWFILSNTVLDVRDSSKYLIGDGRS